MAARIQIGEKTREVIKADSPDLAEVNIIAVGETVADGSYSIERDRFPCGHLIATISGEGECQIGNEWQRCLPGTVFLNPPGSGESFRSARGGKWTFCWLHLFPEYYRATGVPRQSLVDADVTPFRHAVGGFLHSSFTRGFEKSAPMWIDLIRFHANGLIVPEPRQRLLDRVWAMVSADPAHPWQVPELATLARMSREQLRLKAKEETGRSPMHQVTHLRMLRAMELLQISDYKLDVVAELVGYENAFSFSHAFFKATGKRPSSWRMKE